MENASKALIIAGSILLSILIIALGMYIFSSSAGAGDTSTLDSMQVSQFNGKFDRYKGIQNGTKVSALLDALISNSRTNESKSEKPYVTYVNGGTEDTLAAQTSIQDATDLKTIQEGLESSHRYYVTMAKNPDTDLIHGIVISYKSDETTKASAKTTAEADAKK